MGKAGAHQVPMSSISIYDAREQDGLQSTNYTPCVFPNIQQTCVNKQRIDYYVSYIARVSTK